jgi:hypothetical protein
MQCRLPVEITDITTNDEIDRDLTLAPQHAPGENHATHFRVPCKVTQLPSVPEDVQIPFPDSFEHIREAHRCVCGSPKVTAAEVR